MVKVDIAKGDTVLVIAGDDIGKRGRVLKVFPDKRSLTVEGVNFVIRHTKPRRRSQQGGRLQKEAPIDISNVIFVCPRCGAETKIERIDMGDGRRGRKCRTCGEIIPIAYKE